MGGACLPLIASFAADRDVLFKEHAGPCRLPSFRLSLPRPRPATLAPVRRG
jgi:hypothetical protein